MNDFSDDGAQHVGEDLDGRKRWQDFLGHWLEGGLDLWCQVLDRCTVESAPGCVFLHCYATAGTIFSALYFLILYSRVVFDICMRYLYAIFVLYSIFVFDICMRYLYCIVLYCIVLYCISVGASYFSGYDNRGADYSGLVQEAVGVAFELSRNTSYFSDYRAMLQAKRDVLVEAIRKAGLGTWQGA